MSLVATCIALAVVIGFAAFSGWRGSRPPDLIRGPRMAPWRFLMLIGITVAIFLLIHLINLAGLDTSAAAPRF
jgi:hypothetical protein